MNNWPIERSQFAHDWLNNRYMISLLALISVVRGSVESSQLDAINKIISSWKDNAPTAKKLMDTYESEMSPRKLFGQSPLNNLAPDDREQLATIAHIVWLERYNIKTQISDIRKCMTLINATMDSSKDFIKTESDIKYDKDLLLIVLDYIYQLCRFLSEKFSQLQKDIVV